MIVPSFDSEFTKHPNFHIVSSFFMGLVFWESLCCLVQSPFAHYVRQCILRRLSAWWMQHRSRRAIQSGQDLDKEAQVLFAKSATLQGMGGKRISLNESIFRRQDNPTLVFVLTLLFFLGSLSQFLSSLVFTISFDDRGISSHDQAVCAFLIAWDSMSFQAARLVGLIVLVLNLRSLGVKPVEAVVIWLVVGAASVSTIVSNALGIGKFEPTIMMTSISNGKTMALCYRQHKLSPSLILSLMSIGFEVYSIIRFLSIIAPPSFPLQRRLSTLFRDFRIVRSISLLTFDLITLVPNAISISYLGDSLPFSIASLIVLVIFNNYHPGPPLFHDVAPQPSPSFVQSAPDGRRSLQYRALVAPHPYSAAALAASSSQLDVRHITDYSGLTSTSGSNLALLGQAIMYSPSTGRKPERPDLPPPVQPEKPAWNVRSGSASRTRPPAGSRRTRASSKSQRSQFVRPILPKAELARQFNDSEQSPDSTFEGALPPCPPRKPHSKSSSSPIQAPQPVRLRSKVSETKRHSAAVSTVKTFTSESIRYGSDILRPEPGRHLRDKMRTSAGTRAPSPTSTRTHETTTEASGHVVTVRTPSRTASSDSWQSDHTTNAYTVARFVLPMPSAPTFSGGWPLPPSSIPSGTAGRIRREQEREPVRRPSPRIVNQSPLDVGSRSDSAGKSEQSVRPSGNGARWAQQPRPMRGPGMQFPPPRNKASAMR